MRNQRDATCRQITTGCIISLVPHQVSYLHGHHKTRDAMNEVHDVDSTKEQGRRNLLQQTSRVVDVTNWAAAQSVAVLVDNALLGSYLSVHRCAQPTCPARSCARLDRPRLLLPSLLPALMS